MRTKKCGLIAVAAAVLLVTALLVTTCEGQFDLGGLRGNSSQKATLSISLAGNDGRTIMPNITIGSFSNFWLEIDDGTTQAVYEATTINLLNAEDLEIEVGEDYTITLEAYTGGAKGTGVLAASGTGSITNATSGANNVNILLNLQATGNGVFTFTIANQTGAAEFDSGSYTITDLNGGSADVGSTAIVFNSAQNHTLPTGFYRVSFTYNKARHQSRTINEILHVFTGITSTYNNAPTPLTKNNFDINFNANGGTLTGNLNTNNPLTANWNTYTLAGGDGTVANPTAPAVPGTDTFIGWFDTNATTGGTEFTPGSTLVYKDWTVYARWLAATSDHAVLDVDFNNITNNSGLLVATGSTSVSLSQINGAGVTITLTSSNDTVLDLDDYDIAWYYSTASIGSALNTSISFTISSANYASLGGGTEIQLVIELTPKTSGFTYSVNVSVAVTAPTP